MKEKHIILRTRSFSTRDPFMGVLSTEPRTESISGRLSVEFENIDRRFVSNLTNKSDVLAVAPVIPMYLIVPTEMQNTMTPPAADIAWGVKAVGADTSPFSGNEIVVAVLDTGVDASHPVFSGVQLIQKNFTSETNEDTVGHGTHCAGTIFGRTTDGFRIGIATDVKKALIGKVLGRNGGSSDQTIAALQWAVENGANVISMSLGIDFPGYVEQLEAAGFPKPIAISRALEAYRANVQLFERLASFIRARGAFGHPTIIVAAAGNESQRDKNSDFEISVSPPAVADGIISVAALGESPQGLVVAPFSNTNANVSGPGVRITSAKAGGGLVDFSGTSMAAPHVAGVAALWAEKIKSASSLTSLELTARLIGSGNTTGFKSGFDPLDTGAGLVHAPQT